MTLPPLQVVSLLLRSGASPNLRDNLGSSALLEACKYGHDAVIRVLKTHGATYVETAPLAFPTPLQRSCTAITPGSISAGPKRCDKRHAIRVALRQKWGAPCVGACCTSTARTCVGGLTPSQPQ